MILLERFDALLEKQYDGTKTTPKSPGCPGQVCKILSTGRTHCGCPSGRLLKALTSAARGEIAAQGPCGGIRWSPRFFVRRIAWHVLDHAWEIEDCVLAE